MISPALFTPLGGPNIFVYQSVGPIALFDTYLLNTDFKKTDFVAHSEQ